MKVFDSMDISILGRHFDTAPMMLFVQFGLYAVTIIYVLVNDRKLQPTE